MAQKIQTIVSTVDDLDNSIAATKRRSFAVGKRRYTIDLCDENAERFDQQMSYWAKAARRVHEGQEDQGAATAAAAPGPHLETLVPVPIKGQRWWNDPPRPFSRDTGTNFSRARGRVRKWARKNGWPGLGERGAVPDKAYERWFDEVWSQLDEPSWEALEASEAAKQESAKSRRGGKK